MPVEKGGPRARYCRKRLVSPKVCSPGSFRVKSIKKGVKLVVCCPKGYYSKKAKRCRVGTISQSLLKRKLNRKCPRM